MKSLPTALSTDQVNTLVDALSQLPTAQVTRHPDIVTVTAIKRATGTTVPVFRAATTNGTQWHAMAVVGLITTV